MPWGDRTSLAPRRRKSGETSLGVCWIWSRGGRTGREDGWEGAMEEEERGVVVVWQDIVCALEEEQGVVHDIDVV